MQDPVFQQNVMDLVVLALVSAAGPRQRRLSGGRGGRPARAGAPPLQFARISTQCSSQLCPARAEGGQILTH